MNNLYKLLIIILFIIPELNAQILISEGFESGTLSQSFSTHSTGNFASPPGIITQTNFGSGKAFGFGRSTCGSNCFDSYKTTFIITFTVPTYVDSIMWKEMEINGNWGSQGTVLVDDVTLGGASLGKLPVNSNVPDATARQKTYAIKKVVNTIKLIVTDITSSSEIIMDDLQITTKPMIVGFEYWFNNDFGNKTRSAIPSTRQSVINQPISTTTLSNGLNVFNFRSLSNSGKYSSISSHLFYKTSPFESTSNPEIAAYEYWLDNDYAHAVTVNTAGKKLVNLNELIAMNTLNIGVHNFNIRFKDNADMWSCTESQFFYKTPAFESTSNPEIVAYEYWLDNDYANAVTINTTADQHVNMNELIEMNTLNNGVHNFNIRFKDNTNMWSNIVSHFFYKKPAFGSSSNPGIITYEYWLDNDYANAVTVNTTADQNLNMNELIEMKTLNNGVHNFNIRFKDKTDMWSSTESHLFYKTPKQDVSPNKVTEYRYWLNNDYANASNIILTPSQQLALKDSINLTQFPKGNYEINFQFKDRMGLWSTVTTDSIEKIMDVNILSNNFEKNVVIYPNPTKGILSVDFGIQLNDIKISIIDIQGKSVYHSENNNGQVININLNTYQSGVYLITILSKTNKATYRVIKN